MNTFGLTHARSVFYGLSTGQHQTCNCNRRIATPITSTVTRRGFRQQLEEDGGLWRQEFLFKFNQISG